MNLFKIITCTLVFTAVFAETKAQVTFPSNGAPIREDNYFVLKNATIHVDAETTIANGILVIYKNKIVEAGLTPAIPANSIVIDLKGKHIYPSFIDLYTTYGMPEVKKGGGRDFMPQMTSNVKGAYGWNQAIKADVEANKLFTADNKTADEMRRLGFGAVLTSQKDGLVRGSGSVVTLSDEMEQLSMLKDKAAAFYAYSKGTSTQDYPSSLMGSIALLRQTYYDAQWYANATDKKEYNISLESFNQLQKLPSIFDGGDKLSVLRADKIGDEFKVNYIIKTNGTEYQRLNEIKSAGNSLIVPLNFPDAFDVEDPFDADNTSLGDLKHWELAPANAGYLEKQNIVFALTSADLKDKKLFFKNLRKAIEYGLSEKMALKALTVVPANMLGMGNEIGKLVKGMRANFFITNDNIFTSADANIYENWCNGIQYKFTDINPEDGRADYNLLLNNQSYKLSISGTPEKQEAIAIFKDTTKTKLDYSLKNGLVSIYAKIDSNTSYRLTGSYLNKNKSFSGMAANQKGEESVWSATKIADFKEPVKEVKKNETKAPQLGEIIYPFMAYGKAQMTSQPILIKNTTVWTNEAEGILNNKDVILQNGKIASIGENLAAPAGAKVIDGKDKHLTAGIIDEHSHVAISRGVNEGTKSSSAEVRIGDVVNSEDINIYRQLSGGVVAAQLLHGSANAIGGQSAIIKFRWGKVPEQMKIAGADGFIKFALGENVKQANWGDFSTVRFPQTRMGVEQVYKDYFSRAKEYDMKMKSGGAVAKGKTGSLSSMRRDLELEALAEILNKKRFITCHSYVQSEINMLMHVADSFGFTVNTFTHILEGYKVADKMKKHGANASTFADWWAYKMEVADAIPGNSGLMTKVGLNTSINSDDVEMGRRLNQEAAKGMKYGALNEQEALKLATLNPAKMLHLDKDMGSIKIGKSADVVLWTNHPLSIYAKVDKTIIDGDIYYDLEEDAKLRDQIKTERARIIKKMMDAKKGGAPATKPAPKKQMLYECETIEEED
jgi:imidazolonepropionase-like amidohydrolase